MTELNEYECQLLDEILRAFGVPDSLTRAQLLQLFDKDEATAFAMIKILLREELIAETGKRGDFELPEKLVLKPKGEKFLKQGGFTKRYEKEQQQPVDVGGTLSKLQQQNMKLQNLRLSAESERDELEQKLKNRQLLQYVLLVLVALAFIIGYWLGKRSHH